MITAMMISVQYNGGWVSPRYYTVDPRLLPSGNPFKERKKWTPPWKSGGIPQVLSTRFSLSTMEMSRLMRDETTAEPLSRDEILRRERGQVNIHFPCVQLTTSRIGNLTRLIWTHLDLLSIPQSPGVKALRRRCEREDFCGRGRSCE